MAYSLFRAFSSRNYKLYVSGQSVSLIGTWMQRTAVYWVVYVDTRSSFMLGLTMFCTQFPSFLFSLFGGVVSDKYNRYRVLIITQVASLVQAALLAILVIFTNYQVWEILLLSALLGFINAFDVPARQALVYDMVDDKNHLPNAIAINSSMVNLARLTGPALAGVALARWGAGTCFMLNAISFVAVIASLLLMRFTKPIPVMHTRNMIGELKAGFAYLRKERGLALIIIYLGSMSLLVLPFNALLPVFAKNIFKGNASTYGFLNSMIGLGAIAGTLFLASLKSHNSLKRILLFTTLVFGVGLMLFSVTGNFALASVFAVVTGFGMMAQVTLSNTIIQTTVAEDMRGRVISYYAMAFFGLQPLGALMVGSVSGSIGAPRTLFAEGIAALCLVVVFAYLMRREVWRKKVI
ncbi:MAG: MFS transporter [Bacteroidia bacterium]|nr:MFS transporter [Bacteroidia bacterium]